MKSSTNAWLSIAALLGSLCACDLAPARPGDEIRRSGKWVRNQMYWEAYHVDNQNTVKGDVGYQLTVPGPKLDCPTGWTANVQVIQGQLPPGIDIANDFSLTGRPMERGHWIVTLRIDQIVCNGERYTPYGWAESLVVQRGETVTSDCYWWGVRTNWGKEISYCAQQTLHFDISGTGRVRI